MQETPDSMTSTQVADELGITRSRLQRAIDAETIRPLIKLPGQTGAYLFDPAEVARARAAGAFERKRQPAAA